ncbi:hypothetical protein [Methyloceanibacter sp.]|uniref:hypothetical protein n=1 Tax=Methyloceanibacter sp. TaxID=1965321 RepID=UPI002BA8482B|nr:hypothetical protein [Methyloceanibacter sp.]HML93567.1 hypothetical protein [Methyloceanibacter sp.]
MLTTRVALLTRVAKRSVGDGPSILGAAWGAVAASLLLCASAAYAEFEIPEVDAEKGAFEAEYRGAHHWGLPPREDRDDRDPLRQSHELELQYSLTDWWMLRLTPNVEQPGGESIEFASLGVETQFVLVPRHGGFFGLALMAGYGPNSLFVDDGTPDEFEFGPVVEVAPGPWLLTLNPRFTTDVGEFAERDGLGFEYAAQLRYQFAERWGAAVLGFGELEELADTGPFESQTHVLGPSLYVFSAPEAEREWTLGAGVLFGLTNASAKSALRITFAMEY